VSLCNTDSHVRGMASEPQERFVVSRVLVATVAIID
jgi:hypothetical protein